MPHSFQKSGGTVGLPMGLVQLDTGGEQNRIAKEQRLACIK
ncbi:hypothetical protein [Devosia sp. SD17-2]|nr:hypothetical protein [Devosia sp. SD17-2]WEJ35103.1 hypothetical protein NYQ88_10070 [Devosia sp. SD17-2]